MAADGSAAPARRRIGYFDVAKLITMASVIAGHTAVRFGSAKTVALVTTFQMPLFFILSGYFMHSDGSFKLRKESRALLLPYAVTALGVVAALCATNLVFHDLGSTRELFSTWLNAAVFAEGDLVANPLWPQGARIGAIWFLWALFWARLEVALVLRLPRPARAPLVVVGFAVALVSARHVFLPFSLQPGVCAALLVYAGTWLREGGRLERLLSVRFLWVPLALVWAYAFVAFEGFSMAVADYGRTALALVRNLAGGVAGTICVVWACRWIEGRLGETRLWSALSRMGGVTLVVLCVHLFEDDVLRWPQMVEGWRAAFPWPRSWLLLLAVRIVADFLVALLIDRVVSALSSRIDARRSARAEACRDR